MSTQMRILPVFTLLTFCLLTGLLAVRATAAEPPEPEKGPSVAKAALCKGIEGREPAGKGTIFEPGQVYCWTQIVDGTGTTITHNYFFRGEKRASVELKIDSPSWRTWSYKTILPSQTGSWRVEIRDEENNLLKEMGFDVVSAMEEDEG